MFAVHHTLILSARAKHYRPTAYHTIACVARYLVRNSWPPNASKFAEV